MVVKSWIWGRWRAIWLMPCLARYFSLIETFLIYSKKWTLLNLNCWSGKSHHPIDIDDTGPNIAIASWARRQRHLPRCKINCCNTALNFPNFRIWTLLNASNRFRKSIHPVHIDGINPGMAVTSRVRRHRRHRRMNRQIQESNSGLNFSESEVNPASAEISEKPISEKRNPNKKKGEKEKKEKRCGNAVEGPNSRRSPGASLILTRNQTEINQRGYCFAV